MTLFQMLLFMVISGLLSFLPGVGGLFFSVSVLSAGFLLADWAFSGPGDIVATARVRKCLTRFF